LRKEVLTLLGPIADTDELPLVYQAVGSEIEIQRQDTRSSVKL